MSADSTVVIEARSKSLFAVLGSLWQYRALYPFLFREITMKKFRATLLGFWWLIVRPLIPAALAIIVFTFVVPLDSHGLPYAVFYFSGMICWKMFHSNVTFMPRTMLWMQGIMKRAYFPKLLVPFASGGPTFIELAVILGLHMAVIGYFFFTTNQLYLNLDWSLLWFPYTILVAYLFSTAIGMVCSVIALFAKDIVFSVRYFAQLFMFLTPVLYPLSFVPEQYRWVIYTFNPMAPIVELSRWSLTGQGTWDPYYVAVSSGVVLVTLLLGIVFFVRAERLLADEL